MKVMFACGHIRGYRQTTSRHSGWRTCCSLGMHLALRHFEHTVLSYEQIYNYIFSSLPQAQFKVFPDLIIGSFSPLFDYDAYQFTLIPISLTQCNPISSAHKTEAARVGWLDMKDQKYLLIHQPYKIQKRQATIIPVLALWEEKVFKLKENYCPLVHQTILLR